MAVVTEASENHMARKAHTIRAAPLRSKARLSRNSWKRLEFEALLSELSSSFVKILTEEVDAAIDHWLRRLVEFLRVDLAGVSQVSPDGDAVELIHFYGIKGSPPPPASILHRHYPWFVEQVRKGQMIRLERIPQIVPQEVAGEFSYATIAGLKSHLMLPLIVAGNSLGALTFGCFRRERTWPDDLVKRLELVAQVFGSALAQKRARLQLSERLVFERLIADLVKDLVNASPDEIDSVIAGGLERLIGHFGVERSWLGQFAEDGSLYFAYSARASGVPATPPLVNLPWYVEELRQGRRVQIYEAHIEGPPRPSPAREYVPESGMRSHLAVPLVTVGGAWGTIGVAAFSRPRRWTEAEARRLGLMGEIMMDALRRREAEQASHRQHDELAHVARVAALGELTAALAHELNHPLAAIRTNAQAARRLLAAGRQPDDLEEVFSDIAKDASRGGDLIQRLRDLLRRRELKKVPLDVNETVTSIQSIARMEAHRHGARLALELASDLPKISGDAVQLQQVVLNLVRNAAEAMTAVAPKLRTVTVRTCAATPEEVTVSVQDAGPPTDGATLDRMFTPFYTTKPDGLGMGLAISRSIIEAHGGHLGVEQRHREGGLVVHFALPPERARRAPTGSPA